MTPGTFVPRPPLLAGLLLSLWVLPFKNYPCHSDKLPGTLFETYDTTLSCVRLWLLGFRFFLLPVKGSFQLSITVPYFAIGLRTYLRLEVDAPQIPVKYPVNGTLVTMLAPSQLRLRDYHTLWYGFPADFGFPG